MKSDKNKTSQPTMDDVIPIATLFKNYRAYYIRRKKELEEELKSTIDLYFADVSDKGK